MKQSNIFPLFLGVALLLGACNKETNFDYNYYSKADYDLMIKNLDLPTTPYAYLQNLPAHLGAGQPKLPDNDRVTLGRVLFYDTQLSKDAKISCASCHKQEIAFSDDKAKSLGVFDRSTDRNSIALGSVPSFSSFYGDDVFNGASFFWDNRVHSAAEQSLASMTNQKEMDMTIDQIVSAVQGQDFYKPLFKYAFGDEQVNSTRITDAIASFVNSMGSVDSKFDQKASISGANAFDVLMPFSGFTPQENNGKALYMNNCATCHSTNFTTPRHSANNGLDENPVDLGIGGFTGVPSEMGNFKVPNLRNVALTGPYMHDGRFQTLEQVIEHYSTGIQASANLSLELRQYNNNGGLGAPKQFNFTTAEKGALLAFLNTLTDEKFVADVRFGDPFKR